ALESSLVKTSRPVEDRFRLGQAHHPPGRSSGQQIQLGRRRPGPRIGPPMAPHDAYRAQVELLIRCLPAVANAPDFALKGGTAINLFLRDMPRLSVDIDLTYLPITDRANALTDIRVQLA